MGTSRSGLGLSAREYASAVWATWWALMLGGVFGIVGALRELKILPDSIRVPSWLWLLLTLLCFSWAQFVAFHTVRLERDQTRVERDEARRRTDPYWMSLSDYNERAARLQGEWEIKLPSPEGAQKLLREGWERDEIDGRPVEVGGKLGKPEHWPIRQRAT
jgi:hypothetical protein